MNDAKFCKLLAIVNGAVPLTLLAWDAIRGELGANSVNYAIRTTGILSLIFLILSLSVTPLKRLTGWNILVAVRRSLGLYAFFYASLHFAIYVVFDRALNFSSTLHEIAARRYLQIGITGLLLMTPLAITSTNGMIHRIGVKRWKALHRLAYVAASAGVLHYALLVKADLRKPVAFAVVLAVLLVSRFVWHYLDLRRAAARGSGAPLKTRVSAAPLASAGRGSVAGVPAAAPGPSHAAAVPAGTRAWTGELLVAKIFRETHDVCTFRLMSPGGGEMPFTFTPGQFLSLQVSADGRRVNRSYTISSSASQRRYCEISVRQVGLCSGWLHQELKVGERLRVTAPAGRFTFTGDEASGVVLIAGGVGITPLMAIVRHLTDSCWPHPICFVIVARTSVDLIFREELQRLSERFPNLRLLVSLTRSEPRDDWSGLRGRLTEESLRPIAAELAHLPVFLCGPNEMMTATKTLLSDLGVSEAQIRTEAFGSAKGAATMADVTAQPGPPPAGDLDSTDTAEAASESTRRGSTGDEYLVNFLASGQRIAVSGAQTLLEASEAAGADIPFECRAGVCGQCRTKLLSGRVEMETDDALSRQDKAGGYILACQSRCQTDITVAA